MFTGIITATGKVKRVAFAAAKPRGGSAALRGSCAVRVGKPAGWKLAKGESVAVDGVCSTVARYGRNHFEVEYMPETLAKTTASRFAKGDVVNLERSLRFGARLGGHLVQGHVDTTGTVCSVRRQGSSRIITIALPRRYGKFIARKGAICVNGVALTVVRAMKGRFSVALIPYTLRRTNAGLLKKGSAVNVEVDVFARYLAQLLENAYAKKK